VDVDGAAGTAQATTMLLESGHRRIAFIGWPAGSGVGDDRRSGWHRTLRAAGIDPGTLDRQTVDGIGEGERVMADLLAEPEPPTAVVCASDSLALGALQAVRRVGARVAVVGFDDTPVAAAVGLTSVSQPLAAAAARCVELLTGVLDGHDSVSPALLEPVLVRRHTA
jgi:DNA-binding LacI/PurR family transcriptional regulator